MFGEVTENDSLRFQQCSSDFLQWFEANPGTRLSTKITLADLRSRNAGRGLVADENISQEEELFAIPRNLVLHTTNSEIYSKMPDLFADLGPWDSLILVIIYEYLRGNASPWYPYLQLLPTTFDTLMFWTSEELSELQGSAVLSKIGKESAEENWSKTIIPIMLNDKDLFPASDGNALIRQRQLLKLAHVAGSMIMAYAFDMEEDDSSKSDDDTADGGESDLTEDDEDNPAKALVPFADMLNADGNRNNARLFHEHNFLIMRATEDIMAGEEIFNDYGSLPRSDLLRMYGYVTDSYAAFDVVEIPTTLLVNIAASSGMSVSYLTQKCEELQNLGMIDDAFVIARPEAEAKLQDVIPVDLKMLVTAFCQPAENFSPSGLTGQAKASGLGLSEASLLSALFINRLSDYKTSLQHDAEILEMLKIGAAVHIPQGVSRQRYEMAVQVRKGEKEILHQLLQLIDGFIAQSTGAKRKREENDMVASTRKTQRR